MKKNLYKKAFTLVELMIVIAIIAVLTAIVTSNFAQSKAKSRDAKRISDLSQIQLALEMAFDRCNDYPSSRRDPLASTTIIDNNCKDPSGNPYTLGYFISNVPTDNGMSYTYGTPEISSNPATDYVLMAKLEAYNSILEDAPTGTFSYSYMLTDGASGISINCDHTSHYCVRPN